MKNHKWLIITSFGLGMLAVVIGACFYPFLPDEVAVHWNLRNEVDGTASKFFAVIGIPLLMLALNGFCIFATENDPKKKNFSSALRTIVYLFVPLLSIFATLFVSLFALGYTGMRAALINLPVGLLILLTGNYLPKCKQNYTMGVKLPWTLNDPDNWNRTHRLAGFLWVIGGIFIMLNAFLESMYLLFAVLMVISVIPGVYSWVLYRRKKSGKDG